MTLQNEIEEIVYGYMADIVSCTDVNALGVEKKGLIEDLFTLIQDREKEAVEGFVRECIEARLEFKDFDTRNKFEKILNEYLESAKPNEKVRQPIIIGFDGKSREERNAVEKRLEQYLEGKSDERSKE